MNNKIKYYLSAFMKLSRKEKYLLFQKLLIGLFPSPRAYVNFVLIWVFLIALSMRESLLVTLVSGLGAVYCLNEWSKEVNKK